MSAGVAVVATAALALAMGAVTSYRKSADASAIPAAAQPIVSGGVAIPAFYTPPAVLPTANGALVRSEPLPLALSLPGINGALPGAATRVMYKSTDSNGGPVAVTGAYLEPHAAWKAGGPRPLAVVGPGTLGQGDQCSASFGLQNPLIINRSTLAAMYEILAIDRLLAKGVAVMVTDYVGLGSTDRVHTYVNRVDMGHAMLDAARVARALPATTLTPTSPIGLYGYSEGGGASAAAVELQPSYAADVTLVGSYVGAPPADLTVVAKAIDGSPLAGALGWAINGLLQAEPTMRPIADRVLNAKGRKDLTALSTACVGDAILQFAFTSSRTWTDTRQSINEIVAAEPAAQAVFAKQRIGNLKPAGPIRLATAVHDNLVPHGQARTLAVDWCNLGGDVTYAPLRLPNLHEKLINHLGPLLADQGAAINWLTDRLAGKSTRSNCSTISRLP